MRRNASVCSSCSATGPARCVYPQSLGAGPRHVSLFGFVYNILTMGIIFPWIFLGSPMAFPGGNITLGILICTLVQIPIAFALVWLSTALPRSRGDYVFQSRVFGGRLGFPVVLSGLVVWTLVWTALSGWLVAALGLAPLFLGLGHVFKNAALIGAGIWATTPTACSPSPPSTAPWA